MTRFSTARKTPRQRRLSVESLEDRTPLSISNGAFDIANSSSPEFGWLTAGTALVEQGHGVLREQQRSLSGLSQEFTIPSGTHSLAFTLLGAQLATNTSNPPDAFEVGLFDANTNKSLVVVAEGLADTDALLNINGDGEVFLGPQVSVPGVSQSGEVITLAYPLTIIVDLQSVAAGTETQLVFDLLGFGSVDAEVLIDDVQLLGDLVPSLSLSIAPETDSGEMGDRFTNFTTVNLIGASESGQDVLLDIDGDGFDDGMATARADGVFRFDQVSLPAGTTQVRVQATNVNGTAEIVRSFVVDTQAPYGRLITPAIGDMLADAPGFVRVDWIDSGDSGPAPATFDRADVTITGVSVDRIENLGGGQVRYWYNDDNESLPHGEIVVTQVSGQVTDRAGNSNAERAHSFARLRTSCPWNNPLEPLDTTADQVIAPGDVLVVINQLNNRQLIDPSGNLTNPEVPNGVPPPFYDVNCDNLVAPVSDVLPIINYLNSVPQGEAERAPPSLSEKFFSRHTSSLRRSPSNPPQPPAPLSANPWQTPPRLSEAEPRLHKRPARPSITRTQDIDLEDIDLQQCMEELAQFAGPEDASLSGT